MHSSPLREENISGLTPNANEGVGPHFRVKEAGVLLAEGRPAHQEKVRVELAYTYYIYKEKPLERFLF